LALILMQLEPMMALEQLLLCFLHWIRTQRAQELKQVIIRLPSTFSFVAPLSFYHHQLYIYVFNLATERTQAYRMASICLSTGRSATTAPKDMLFPCRLVNNCFVVSLMDYDCFIISLVNVFLDQIVSGMN